MCCVFSAPEDFRVNPGTVEAVIQHLPRLQKVHIVSHLAVFPNLERFDFNTSRLCFLF